MFNLHGCIKKYSKNTADFFAFYFVHVFLYKSTSYNLHCNVVQRNVLYSEAFYL